LSTCSACLCKTLSTGEGVAADTEEEARQIASGRDWWNPRFAVCDALGTPEAHVFGDVVFRSEPVAVEKGKPGGEAEMTWNARGSR
jgi:hypothetical protein